MNKLKAIIVDDERLARVNLKNLCQSFPGIEIVGEADSCLGAIELILDYKPRIIFLDIQLNGETGFDLLPKIDDTIKVVFVTAFDEYAIRAFEVNASDYLLKPVNPERLKVSINRIFASNAETQPAVKRFEYTDSIYVRLNNFTSTFIKISSIISIVSLGNYSKIETHEGKHCIILKTLKQWEEELPDNYFKRIPVSVF